ncbi:hypothetical protein BpHYR1_036404 [Brachionus plicatilis]|uniref:Uncharacterized protein n=1 Tax=Brachionus plicatilis TaxID=10195 RepID=A0A3M7T6C0_BRAPC|nr:hypothetical protein BpHYR1_036404 [Brachionus plicatilis]
MDHTNPRGYLMFCCHQKLFTRKILIISFLTHDHVILKYTSYKSYLFYLIYSLPNHHLAP